MSRLAIAVLVVAACSRTDSAPKPAPEPMHVEKAPAGFSIEARIDGAPTTWAEDVFDRVEHHAVANNRGQPRDTWSLRDLVHAMVGANARVVAVVGATKQAITPEAWADASRTPVVHRTGRGGLKFRWADASGKWDEESVNDVVALEIVR
ncbi:MAG: hypothetical protein HOV81_24975 [Kofleriaceae bacterium]|nr:hypothetical protein [Kofleriaceae bacterium]